MFNETSRTPTPEATSQIEDDFTSSPRSLISQLDSNLDGCSDEASLSSDQNPSNLEEMMEVAMDLVGDEDDDRSVHSGKTNKTIATASTQSLSFHLSHSSSATALLQGGDSYEVEIPNPTQQHTHPRNGGYSRLSSNFDSFEEHITFEQGPVVLGMDISHLSSRMQFIILASGVFCFSLLYGYLQELISVQILNRQLGLFLSTIQFTGYTILSYILRTYVNAEHEEKHQKQRNPNEKMHPIGTVLAVPLATYVGLSLLRAVDLAMTNMAMQYINYPAKTLMKSGRVVFTMIFGVFILRKKYLFMDYFIVLCMVAGLAIFMHADATSSAVFQPLGVIMLTVSLLCDGAITNMSETIMSKYGVGQDEFIFRMYSIALIAVASAAAFTGDLQVGMAWLLKPGTYDEAEQGVTPGQASWSVGGKIALIVLFSSMGLLSSSCSAAITKHFGALAMSITSTARKATTLFLSFFLFNNVCTLEHIAGVTIFIAALTAKSLRRRKDSGAPPASTTNPVKKAALNADVMHRLKGEAFPIEELIERSPRSPFRAHIPVSPKGCSFDVESHCRLDFEKQSLTRRTERGTPIGKFGKSRSTNLSPSSANVLDLPRSADGEIQTPSRAPSRSFKSFTVVSSIGSPSSSLPSELHAGKTS